MGLLIGLFVLTQSTFVPRVPAEADPQEESGTSSEQEKVQISEAVTTSGSQINVEFQSFLLAEVILDSTGQEKKSPLDLLVPPAKKALNVLFRRIISPNAP